MPTYISLISWTDEGIKNYQGTFERGQVAAEAAAALGGNIKETYWTIGPYDVVAIGEFPDDESATAFLLKVGSGGTIRTTSMRAFTQDEMTRVVEKAQQ
jgi:uncharacterized protein with GYD domain